MKKILTIAIALFALATTAHSQRQVLMEKINEIKRQSDSYFWYENTQHTADSAIYYGTLYMLNDINFVMSDQYTFEQIAPIAKHINIDRGSKVMAFVYVKKSDVETLNSTGIASTTHSPSLTEPASTPSAVQTPVPQSHQTEREFVPDLFVQRILQTGNFRDVHRLLRALKADKQILQFGALKDVEDYSSFDLILFDKNTQLVLTLLSGVIGDGKTRINLVTGTPDSLDNYPTEMIAVIWYIK